MIFGLILVCLLAPLSITPGQSSPIAISVTSAQTTLPTCVGQIANTVHFTGTGDFYQVADNTKCQPTSEQMAAYTKVIGSQCSATDPANWITACFLNPILGAIGLAFLEVGTFILRLVGWIFDTLVLHVVIGFGSLVDPASAIGGAITNGWGAFRDLANILIIGMFTFIAISTILGSKEYGYKKLVARVLIIAVLMNFSLLFTKLIIDASNFTAYQFYTQIAGQGQSGTSGSTQLDVAQAFLQPMGIASVWQMNMGGTIADPTINGGGWQGLFIGLLGGVLLIIVALVLLYGVVLIGSRAVILIVLMLTSAAAFTTYLIPNFAESEYGWKGWWKALINCAVFAPLLMLFLSVSLLIVQGASATNTGATFGSIASNPSLLASGGAWQLITTYLITIGLLFVSFKISSQFANTTSGISLAAGALLSPLTLGARFAGGAVGRQVFGARASEKEIAAREELKRAQAKLRAAPVGTVDFKQASRDVARLKQDAEKYGQRARSAFNVNDTKVPKFAMKSGFGLSGFLAGQTPAGQKQVAAVSSKPVAAPTPAGDAEIIKKSIDNLATNQRAANDTTAKLADNVIKLAEHRAQPAAEAGPAAGDAQRIDSQQKRAEAEVQHRASEQRSRLSEEGQREKNALTQVMRDRIANRTSIDNRLDSARKTEARINGTTTTANQSRGPADAPTVNVTVVTPKGVPLSSEGAARVSSETFHAEQADKAVRINNAPSSAPTNVRVFPSRNPPTPPPQTGQS